MRDRLPDCCASTASHQPTPTPPATSTRRTRRHARRKPAYVSIEPFSGRMKGQTDWWQPPLGPVSRQGRSPWRLLAQCVTTFATSVASPLPVAASRGCVWRERAPKVDERAPRSDRFRYRELSRLPVTPMNSATRPAGLAEPSSQIAPQSERPAPTPDPNPSGSNRPTSMSVAPRHRTP